MPGMQKPDKRLWLGANLQSRDGTLTKDALVTNGFLEKKGENVRTFKRGGLNLVTALGTGSGQGMTNFVDSSGNEVLYAAQAGTLYLGNIPPASGAWTTTGAGGIVTTLGATVSFGGYIWTLGENFIYYKLTATTAAWTSGASNIFSSVDANTRNQGTLVAFNGALYYIAPSISGSGTGSKEVWKSFDGLTWSRITAAAAFSAQPSPAVLVYGGYMWLLSGVNLGNNNVWNSTDGITWTLVAATPAYGSTARTQFSAAVYKGVMIVACGTVTATSQKDVWSSTDGITWTQIAAAPSYTAVAFPTLIPVGGVLYLCGGKTGGAGVDQVYSSPDAITWTTVSHSGFDTSPWNTSPVITWGLLHKGQVVIYSATSHDNYPPVSATGGASLGTIASGTMVDFAKNLDGTQIMVRADGFAYKLVPSTNTLTVVSDGDYPIKTVRGCVYLDGVFYVMESDGTIWGSDNEDCTSWNALNFITAEFEPDSGVCLGKYNNYVVAFGQWTTQMFWDAANPTPASALAPVQNGVLLVGCAHANSVAQIESTLLFMAQRKGQGSSFQKGRFIAMLEGQSYVQISTPDVDRILDADDLATVYSCVGSFAGHNFYILGLGTTGASLVYDMTEKFWYIWTRTATGSNKTISALSQSAGLATATSASHGFSDGDPITISGATQSGYNLTQINVTYVDANTFTYPVASGTVSPATGSPVATPYSESYFSVCASCNYGGQQVFQDVSGGNIFSLLDTIFQDNALPINFKIRSSNQDLGTNHRKFCTMVTPICDMPSSVQYGLLRNTDNDYQTYSTYRRHDISDVKPDSNRWGNYRRRAWEWRYTGNTRHRIESLEVEQEVGSG